MAGSSIHTNTRFPLNSHDTALCIIPPTHLCTSVDQLRALYDKGWRRWPPHVNLIYPFVDPGSLPWAKEQIESSLTDILSSRNLKVSLNRAGYFSHRQNHTIFLCEENEGKGCLDFLRSAALESLGHTATSQRLHLTVGQSDQHTDEARDFLLSKAKLIPRIDFDVLSLAILIRQRSPGEKQSDSRMMLWGTVELRRSSVDDQSLTSEFWLRPHRDEQHTEPSAEESGRRGSETSPRELNATTHHSAYLYSHEVDAWQISQASECINPPVYLRVSSYNVLMDFDYPPTRQRFPLLVENLLSRRAMADILVLQEVSDDFLSHLLSATGIQQSYPYASHGPPNQPDIAPLPNRQNVVILSKYPFTSTWVSFPRKHKGATIAMFSMANKTDPSAPHHIVVAGIHLTCGLTPGSVAAKKAQLQHLKNYLASRHPESAWIIAGDFNITTSTYTIRRSLKDGLISKQTVEDLAAVEVMLAEAGLNDAWPTVRLQAADDLHDDVDDLYDGEDGATFNPRQNSLAAATSGTSANRPQRYDRILVRPQGIFQFAAFNDFGQPKIVDGVEVVASDHSGVRTIMKVMLDSHESSLGEKSTLNSHPVQKQRSPLDQSEPSALASVLDAQHLIPAAEEVKRRSDAFNLLKEVLLGSPSPEHNSSRDVPMIIVPVGSYALGVWDSSSDIDCLCIGSISSKTFFQLARQRIRRADSRGVQLLRKVNANTGTMFELRVNGVSMDLQYCPAGRVAERWSEMATLHHTDSMFNLPLLSLRKLKPYRDITYIRRSLPSLSTFRLAYRCIKLWAVQRGLHSNKFGYLSGVHITIMLSWVCKRLGYDHGAVSVPDIVATFFHHYAHFDWSNDIVFDAFFHKKQPRYHRTAREPMVILGPHTPNANIAHTSTVPSVNILVKEFDLAYRRLREDGITWDKFFSVPNGAESNVSGFLTAHDSYGQVSIQYWGRSLSRGKGLVGWVESRCLLLVVDINKALPAFEVRIWPARFTDQVSTSDLSSDYHGCYLIGLSKPEDSGANLSKEEKAQAKQALETVFSRFINQLKTDEKNYDASTSWIDISLVKPQQVAKLQPDTRDWGDYTADDIDQDSDDDIDVDDETSDPEATTTTLPYRPPHHQQSSSPGESQSDSPKPKLRPASDILSRLRWDPSLNPSDYIVGYEDRFLGPKEMPLDRWKSDVSEDEFVPMHRILWFRKKDGEVVWDRKARIDLMFGSGGSGNKGQEVET